ncbi:MAG: hypothetical protein A2252_07155 [Elusimicrobia bacterium RIFOXYA2_FULL_39_19]|nr:MAG: hypothetical protein A2252_07155 [Elusimicrobia bacterium RIFOXYA2_FULL_39_19]
MWIFIKKYKVIAIIISVLILITFIGLCARKGGNEIAVKKAFKDTLIVTVTSNGTVRSNNEAKLSTVASGKIVKINVQENEIVEKGTVLLELNSEEQAQKDYKRMASLGEKGFIAPQQVELAKEQWGNTLIKAPFNGTIAKRFLEVGEMLIGGTPAFLLADLTDMIVETNIDETDIGFIKVGQPVEITLDAYKSSKLTGRIQFIARSSLEVKEKGITYLVKIKLYPTKDITLRLGMTCDVNIRVAEKKDVLMIPYTALGEDEGKKFVFIAEKNVLKRKFVTTGLENYDNTEILSGLAENEIVIENNTSKLKEGQKVKVKLK